jgi:3-deoxy-manno-octulosonate cytidylyltransferase (CMP-KDO synthetase)
VNLQGDEPDISGRTLDQVVATLEQDRDAPMATVATPIHTEAVFRDPSCVKVVCSPRGRALYFSRSPIPHNRNSPATLPPGPHLAHLHLGLYAYRRDFLLLLASLPPAPLEELEKLEQLRVLSLGRQIAVGIVAHASVGVDTPEDYERFVQFCRRRQAGQAA